MRDAQHIALPESAWPEALQQAAAVLAAYPAQRSSGDTPAVLAREEFLRGRCREAFDREDVRRVNARLFPHALARLKGLAYAGVCVEVTDAGGDYYDFLDCGPARLRFAIADVSGKGLASAMLRVALQASLRTQTLMGAAPLEQALSLLNRLLFESTPQEMYCTLFLAEYDATSGMLRYVNCGHPTPVLQSGSRFLALAPTATVLGLFPDWQGAGAEVELGFDDTLLLYTDGASEVTGGNGREFGIDGLLTSLQTHAGLPPSSLLQACLSDIRQFAQQRQEDDLTLVAVRRVQEDEQ